MLQMEVRCFNIEFFKCVFEEQWQCEMLELANKVRTDNSKISNDDKYIDNLQVAKSESLEDWSSGSETDVQMISGTIQNN